MNASLILEFFQLASPFFLFLLICAVVAFISVYLSRRISKKAAQKDRAEIEQNFERLREKYMNNPVTLQIANECSEMFARAIEARIRNTSVPEIIIEYRLSKKNSFANDDVMFKLLSPLTSGTFDLEKYNEEFYCYSLKENNLAAIPDSNEFYVFLHAIALNIKKTLTERFPKDPSGTEYTIKVSEDSNAMVKISYCAKNGNYASSADRRSW